MGKCLILYTCREGVEVTDDVSIVEHLGHPVYITEGSYTNIKVASPSLYISCKYFIHMLVFLDDFLSGHYSR